MKILSIDFTSEEKRASYSTVFDSFIQGLTNSGATIDSINVSKMNIGMCQGCTSDLSFASTGKCNCDDDIQKIHPLMKLHDTWLLIVPIEHSKSPQSFINFLDRMEPFFEIKELTNGSATREKIIMGAILVSEDWPVEPLSRVSEEIAKFSRFFGIEYAGSLMRPHIGVIESLRKMGIPLRDIENAAAEAGKKLVQRGAFPEDILDIIVRELVPEDSFIYEIQKLVS